MGLTTKENANVIKAEYRLIRPLYQYKVDTMFDTKGGEILGIGGIPFTDKQFFRLEKLSYVAANNIVKHMEFTPNGEVSSSYNTLMKKEEVPTKILRAQRLE